MMKILITFFILQGETLNQAYCVEISGYMNFCIEKGLNFGPKMGFSAMTMLQITRCSRQTVSGPRKSIT
jgi:hypothetical protein